MEYELISSTITSHLVTRVNKWLAEGWKPLGAPFESGSLYYQALVKETAQAQNWRVGLG